VRRRHRPQARRSAAAAGLAAYCTAAVLVTFDAAERKSADSIASPVAGITALKLNLRPSSVAATFSFI